MGDAYVKPTIFRKRRLEDLKTQPAKRCKPNEPTSVNFPRISIPPLKLLEHGVPEYLQQPMAIAYLAGAQNIIENAIEIVSTIEKYHRVVNFIVARRRQWDHSLVIKFNSAINSIISAAKPQKRTSHEAGLTTPAAKRRKGSQNQGNQPPSSLPSDSIPKLDLPKITPVRPRLRNMGVPKRSADEMSKAYLAGCQAAIRSTMAELKGFWATMNHRHPGKLAGNTVKFKIFAAVILPQLTRTLIGRFDLVISVAEDHLRLHHPAPKPKWDKSWVPVFTYLFASPFGIVKYPSCSQTQSLMKMTKLSHQQITDWFQNRRARTKKKAASLREPLRDYHWTDDLPADERKAAIRSILGQRLGSLPSLMEQREEMIRNEYRTGRRVNALETWEPSEHSFPEPIKERIVYAPEFEVPEWPRSAVTRDTRFVPIQTGDIHFLADQLSVTHVTMPEEDPDVIDIVDACDTLALEPKGDRDSDTDDDSDSDEDEEEHEDEQETEAIIELSTADLESVGDDQSDTEAPTPVPCCNKDPAFRGAEESLRILQKGVGKVPLKRMTGPRRSTNMAPPAPPPRGKSENAVCRNVFDKHHKHSVKRRLLIIRELPDPVHVTEEVVQEVLAETVDKTYDELHDLITEILQADSEAEDIEEMQADMDAEDFDDDDDEDSDLESDEIQGEDDIEDGDEMQPEYQYEDWENDEYWDQPEDTQPVLGGEPAESEIRLLTSITQMKGYVHFPDNDHYDEADLGDIPVAYALMRNVNLTPYDSFQPPKDIGVPECFNIPFDPEIAQVALEMTLEQLGITLNYAQPIYEAGTRFDTFRPPPANDPEIHVTEEDIDSVVDVIALCNAATDKLFAPNPTYELGEARPTYLEEYQATLPVYFEGMDYPGPEDGHTFLDARSIDLETLAWPPENTDFSSFLSAITDVNTNHAAAVPAIFASQEYAIQESEFPEEYGDGSQYLVLDPDYDLKEWEQIIFQFPSFLPPGGIPTDRDPYIEPPPMASYAPPPPEECRIFVTHGPTQTFIPLPPPPPRAASPSPLIVIPLPLSPLLPILPLPPTPSEESDGTEVSQNGITTGLTSLISILTSAPRYLLGSGAPELPPLPIEDIAPMSWKDPPPPVPPLEDEFRLQTRSTWPTSPLLESLLDWF